MYAYLLYACPGSGNCYKPRLAMQKLGISFDLKILDILSGEQKSSEYLAINPQGVVPYLKTPQSAGIGESNAMLWYLAENTHLMPQDRLKRARAMQWMLFEQSKPAPLIAPARFFTTILPQVAQERKDKIKEWHRNALAGLEIPDAHLASNRLMPGALYSLTDIAIYGYTHVLDEAGLSLCDVPNVARWIDTVSQTKSYVPPGNLGKKSHKAVA